MVTDKRYHSVVGLLDLMVSSKAEPKKKKKLGKQCYIVYVNLGWVFFPRMLDAFLQLIDNQDSIPK